MTPLSKTRSSWRSAQIWALALCALLPLTFGPLLQAQPPTEPAEAQPAPAPQSAPRQDSDGRQGFTESVDVRLRELYVTVTNRDGEPVANLQPSDFLVRENGNPQILSSARPSAELPILLGLVIDTSASMFVKLGPVSRAARQLVRGLEQGKDQAFVVGFGPTPRMSQAPTGDLLDVDDALRGLEAEGRTPLWGSIAYALDTIAAYRGKRALVIFFDGADEDGNRPYREALEKARRAGIPVYLIVMNNEAARTEGRDFSTRAFISRLERIAATGGGAVYFVPTQGDLTPIYRRIERELRSAYLLTYYPEVPLAQGGERKVEVAIPGRSYQVRALSEYRPVR